MAMTERDLTREQLDAIMAKIWPTANYLARLSKRIDAERFPWLDGFRLGVADAYGSMQRLTMAIHYLNCATSTGGYAQEKEVGELLIHSNVVKNGQCSQPI